MAQKPAAVLPHQGSAPPRGIVRQELRHEVVRSGPLPDPEEMARYEEILPGFSERLLRRLEREGEHRQATETKIVDAEIAKQNADNIIARRGQDYAFAIAFVGLVSSAVGIYLAPTPEHAYAAASIAGASLATLVGIFVLGRKLKPSSEAADEESKPQDGQRSFPAPTDKAK